jgi:hypothetical protein
MPVHQCNHPLRHRLVLAGVMIGGTLLAANAVPRLVYALTGSGPLAFLSLPGSLMLGWLLMTVLRGRCQPVRHDRRRQALRGLLLTAWALRESK